MFEGWVKTVAREEPLHSKTPASLETENDISVSAVSILFNFRNLRKFGYVTGFIT
jgi:hypothetical protein